ncbi:MAG: GDP-mannose 4,6-dehydratase, partial [Candidatus Marinimicrobia bacterium]|nr:GDP-mannose 4,6-dehydratase [Candidatus Neomarinimicrobiota bacterium]
MKRILITGVAGFIGYHLTRRLLKAGYQIFGIDNLNHYYDPALKKARLSNLQNYNPDTKSTIAGTLRPSTFDFRPTDLQDYTGLTKVFNDFNPDIVINLAAQAGVRYSLENPRAYIQSNLDGFFNILEAAKQHGVQDFIYASSSSVYGNNYKSPFTETDRVDHPVSLYAATKKSNELIAHTYSHLYQMTTVGL